MNRLPERPWFTAFAVELDDRPTSQIIWADGSEVDGTPVTIRQPTSMERASILLIGGIALGAIVIMVVSLIVAVYISRR